jgi:dCTP diphosphatase
VSLALSGLANIHLFHSVPLTWAKHGEAMSKKPSIRSLTASLQRFADQRDWDQFHSPKNLAAALSVEAGELLEHFQWLRDEESHVVGKVRDEVALEMADVFLYLLRLAHQLDVDLLDAAQRKLAINARKYPVKKARGTSKKYTDL